MCLWGITYIAHYCRKLIWLFYQLFNQLMISMYDLRIWDYNLANLKVQSIDCRSAKAEKAWIICASSKNGNIETFVFTTFHFFGIKIFITIELSVGPWTTMKFYISITRDGWSVCMKLTWKDIIIRILMCLELFWHFKSNFRYIINKTKNKLVAGRQELLVKYE